MDFVTGGSKTVFRRITTTEWMPSRSILNSGWHERARLAENDIQNEWNRPTGLAVSTLSPVLLPAGELSDETAQTRIAFFDRIGGSDRPQSRAGEEWRGRSSAVLPEH